jgi:hypothetical protein
LCGLSDLNKIGASRFCKKALLKSNPPLVPATGQLCISRMGQRTAPCNHKSGVSFDDI